MELLYPFSFDSTRKCKRKTLSSLSNLGQDGLGPKKGEDGRTSFRFINVRDVTEVFYRNAMEYVSMYITGEEGVDIFPIATI